MTAVLERAPRYGPDAILTPANVVSTGGLVGNLDVARKIYQTDVEPSNALFAEHVGMSLLDLCDGWLADKFGKTTVGRWLDTGFDKVGVTAKLFALAKREEYPWAAFWVIVGRETGVLAYKSWVESQGVKLDDPAFPNRAKVWVQQAETSVRIFPATADNKPLRAAVTALDLGVTVGTGVYTVVQGERKRRALKGEDTKIGGFEEEQVIPETLTQEKQSRFRLKYKARLQYLLRQVSGDRSAGDTAVRLALKKEYPNLDQEAQLLVLAHERQVLEGARVVVSGATGAIGAALVKRYASMGAEVVMLARNKSLADQMAAQISAETNNPHVCAVEVDLSSQKSIREAVAGLTKGNRGINFLINNAGLTPASFSERGEKIDDFMRVNYLGNAALTLELLPEIQSVGGNVVNITARRSRKGDPKHFHDNLFLEETEGIEPKQFYSDAKLAADILWKKLLDTYGDSMGFYAVHPGNVWKNIGGGIRNPFYRMSHIPGGKAAVLTADEAALEIARISLLEEPGKRYEWGEEADLPRQITPEVTNNLIERTYEQIDPQLTETRSTLQSLHRYI